MKKRVMLSRTSAVAFLLWGLLHIAGGLMILIAAGESPDAGFAYYKESDGPFNPLSGAVLSYFSYLIVCAGVAASVVAIRLNWRNSQLGLAINTLMISLIEVGLVIFLVLPGFTPIAEAAPGLVLMLIGIVAGGVACRGEHGT